MPAESNLEGSYLLEKDRIASFKKWPFTDKHKCNIKKMAEAGFFWKGIDSVACFLCGKELDGWEPEDDPWSEHKKHAPQCVFVKFGRPENELKVGEFIDLMDVYIIKLQHESEKKVTEFTTEKMAEIKEKISVLYKN